MRQATAARCPKSSDPPVDTRATAGIVDRRSGHRPWEPADVIKCCCVLALLAAHVGCRHDLIEDKTAGAEAGADAHDAAGDSGADAGAGELGVRNDGQGAGEVHVEADGGRDTMAPIADACVAEMGRACGLCNGKTLCDGMCSCTDDPRMPVAYWKFDEGMGMACGDSSGKGNGGSFTAGPYWEQGGFKGAKFPNHYVLGFKGTGQTVLIQNKAIL